MGVRLDAVAGGGSGGLCFGHGGWMWLRGFAREHARRVTRGTSSRVILGSSRDRTWTSNHVTAGCACASAHVRVDDGVCDESSVHCLNHSAGCAMDEGCIHGVHGLCVLNMKMRKHSTW